MSVLVVLERLVPLIGKEVNLVVNSKQEIQNLSSKFKQIQEVLQDAERRGVTDPSVKTWLEKLHELSYEVDDVLDEWETKNLQLQIQEFEENNEVDHATLGEKVGRFVQSLCLCFEHVVDRRSIAVETKGLNEKLDLILEEKDKFNFLASGGENLGESKRVESTSFVDDSSVYGRKSDKDNLSGKLLSEGEGISTKIVCLVGPGGLGKTTLAQLVYNDSKIKEHFELRSWIHVSDPFDERRIARNILGGVEGTDPDTLQSLLERVHDFISKRKFLIVLDDVWGEDCSKWEPLRSCLKGLPGSRVLVTTRSERVARVMGSHEIQWLGYLSKEDCWSILSRIAFGGRMKEECKKLEGVGRKIAMKCKGLPLAAKSMGSMLSFRNSLREWEDVLESPLWKLEEVAEEVFRVLNLSYSDLSPVLKRCFSCCALYHKDEKLNLPELISIWLAHGYLSSKEMVDKVYLKGLQYFGNLVMRSFFQDVQQYGDDESKMTFKIHDIVHDFAISLSKTEYCFILDGKNSSHQTYDNLSFDDIGKVRSFSARYVSQDILTPYLFKSLKRVRLLRLVDCDLKELPQEIGELIHLRYLELRGIPIQELPETLCNLHNLQTLHLECCGKLHALPQGIHKLINLRHLLICVEVFPQGLSKLTGLWTLKRFRAGRGSNKLGYLQNLNQLRGSLHLTLEDMDEDDDLVEAEKAELTNKIHILELNLFILGNVRMDVMDVLQLPPNLHTLQLDYYKCNRFPKWITSFNYLRELSIRKCRNCSSLPLLGILPMLEELSVYHMENLEWVGNEFLGIKENVDEPSSSKFPMLKKLCFDHCNKWEEWKDISEEVKNSFSVMPNLCRLQITNCGRLKSLPHRLLRLTSSLQTLYIEECQFLTLRYKKSWGPNDNHLISHIPDLSIVFESKYYGYYDHMYGYY